MRAQDKDTRTGEGIKAPPHPIKAMNNITDDIKAAYNILEQAKRSKHEHTLDILLAAAKKLNPSLDIATYKAQWLTRWMKNKKKERNT